MCRTVEDFLSRRTRLLLLEAKESIKIAPVVATLMASELGRDEKWIAGQIKDYRDLAEKYILS
jgi:glycerol-3-phosphate dehydrogenase